MDKALKEQLKGTKYEHNPYIATHPAAPGTVGLSLAGERWQEGYDFALALLQLRMLSKDEAEKALEIFGEAGYTESHMSCQCLNHRTIAKLKLIQEEDSE